MIDSGTGQPTLQGVELVPRLGQRVTSFGDFVAAAELRDTFWQRGFASIEKLVTPSDVAEVSALVADLLEHPEPRADGMLYDYARPGGALDDPLVLQLLLPCDYQPALFETRFFREASAVARELLGEPVLYRGSHYLEKPPGRDNPTPWHQDEAFWEPASRHEAIGIWLSFDAADAACGCPKFLPGSHLSEAILRHRHLGGDARTHGLEIEPALLDTTHAVTCELGVGDVSVHHCRTVHGTGPNRSARTRRTLVLNFAAPPTPLTVARDFPWQRGHESDAAARRAARRIELP